VVSAFVERPVHLLQMRNVEFAHAKFIARRDVEMLPLADLRQRSGWLVCPMCKGQLRSSESLLACAGCGEEWQQTANFANLLPAGVWNPACSAWAQRQQTMAASYRDLIADPQYATRAYHYDFDSYAAQLATYSGRILDIGGGNGLVRHFLSPGVDYVSLDPSIEWLQESWDVLGDSFPCLRRPIQFVCGVAEHIPFADGFFDGVLAFWSLNHCADPQRSVREIARVLRPGGRCLIVLEEVEPRWRDIMNLSYRDHRSWTRGRLAWEKSKASLMGWPLQPDHLRINESDVEEWSRGTFSQIYRGWHGSYLTIELILN
jgi:SAM-dependent methyltransferase